MARRPWWEWDAAELKHSTEVPAGYKIDYYEKPHGNDVWRKYLIEGEALQLSVSDISSAIDDGKSSAMAWKAGRIWRDGICELVNRQVDMPWDDPEMVEELLKRSRLRHTDQWDDKADLGTLVHTVLESLCANTVPTLSDFDTDVQPYVRAVCGWYADNDPHVLDTEFLVASREYKFAGRFDLLYEQNGQRVLADLKTSKAVYPSHLIQLAGYSLALEECGYAPVDRMEVIWAKPDGSYKVVDSKATHRDFLNHLAAYCSFNTNKDYLEALAA